MIQVAVMGYGTVGSGVVEVIEKNKDEIWEQIPTAATDNSPWLPIMMVSTMLAVVDKKF